MTEATTAPAQESRKARADFYKQCRTWHGYLSAFAFIALIFLSVTGLLLNHPEWFAGDRTTETRSITLAPDILRGATTNDDPARALTEAVSRKVPVRGAFADGSIEGGAATLRLEGVKGTTDITIDMASGQAEVTTETADTVSIFHELHRGTLSGPVWRALLDFVAIAVTALSLVGFALFFILRQRLRTSLLLMSLGLGIPTAIYLTLVP